VKVVGDASKVPSPLQLIVSKTYKTPTSVGCDLVEVAHDQLVVSVPDISKDIVSPDSKVATGVETPNISNATLSLAPGETATVTLRGYVPLTEMAKTMAAVTPAPVPANAPPTPAASTVTYKQWGTIAGNPVFVKTPTVTTLTQSGATTYASVAPKPGYPNNPRPSGTVTFVRTRAGVDTVLASVLISEFTGDSPFFTTSPVAGDTIVVIYSGDDVYAASSSNVVQLRQLGLFVRAETSYVEVELKDTTTGTLITGTDAHVTFNGVNVPWVGLPTGYYLPFTGTGNLPYATPGMAVNVSVTTLDGQTASATGAYPGQPSITAPANHATPFAGNRIPVSWTPVANRYVLMAYCNSLVNSILCTGGYQRVVAPSSSFEFPVNTFVAGQQAQLWLLALNDLTFTGATVWGESYAGLSAVVYLDPVAAPTLYMTTGTASIQNYVSGPYKSFNVTVQDPTTFAEIDKTQIAVTLTSSSSPSTPVTLPSNPYGGFGTSGLSIMNPGDTLTASITRTVNGTVVAQSNCRVNVPGFATLLTMWMPSAPVTGMTVTTTWAYPTNIANPQTFWIWPSNLGTNPVPTGGTTDREMWYSAFGVPPFTARITSLNMGATCDGSGSGSIVARTDDNVDFPVTTGVPIP
jgi:hypothetical protein